MKKFIQKNQNNFFLIWMLSIGVFVWSIFQAIGSEIAVFGVVMLSSMTVGILAFLLFVLAIAFRIKLKKPDSFAKVADQVKKVLSELSPFQKILFFATAALVLFAFVTWRNDVQYARCMSLVKEGAYKIPGFDKSKCGKMIINELKK